MNRPRRKTIRLPATIYATEGIVFSITIGTRARRGAFVLADIDLGKSRIGVLRDLRMSSGARVYTYCLMPDHVHLLLGASAVMSITSVVQRWKSLCYREWIRRGNGPASFWQRSFWDHGLRVDEDLFYVGKYILSNPVRAGLVCDFHDYPLCGSLEWDL